MRNYDELCEKSLKGFMGNVFVVQFIISDSKCFLFNFRLEEKVRRDQASEQDTIKKKLHYVKKKGGTQNVVHKKEGQCLSSEQNKKCPLGKGEEHKISNAKNTHNRKKGSGILFLKKEVIVEIDLEDCEIDDEKCRKLEEQRVLKEEEKHLVINEKEKSPDIEEQENRLNISSSTELHNRRLDNVNMKVSN